MRFEITHLTEYRYSGPVRLGPHVLRLTPRPAGIARLTQRIDIDPAPVLRAEETDAHGNRLVRVEFGGAARHLRIESRFELETLAPPPLPDGLPPLPWGSGEVAPEVAAFAAGLAEGGDPLGFLDRLNEAIHGRTDFGIRPSGKAQPPEVTLAEAAGACRDTAVLFMAAARSQGMEARFVSGYQAGREVPGGRRYLHGWPEVRIGDRWQGFDPTHGSRVGEGHVALAAAPEQAGTMPVSGSYAGTGVSSAMTFDLRISTSG